jgi:hypothetical protein
VDDEFIKRLRSREIARTDQREARDETARDSEQTQQMVRQSARSAFDEMRSCAETLVEQVNPELTEKFMNFASPGGFGIKLGNKTASFTYAPPFFANEGIPHVIVTFQSLANGWRGPSHADPYQLFVDAAKSDRLEYRFKGVGGLK